jgi:hypothetical protein
MPSKNKEARLGQKTYLESQLNQRLAGLAEKGLEPAGIAKDVEVKRLRAEIRKANARLRVIREKEKKLEEMARIRAEKAAAPKKEKGKKKKGTAEEEAASKRQQKKKGKKEKKEAQKGSAGQE